MRKSILSEMRKGAGRMSLKVVFTLLILLLVLPVGLYAKEGYSEISGTIIIDNSKGGVIPGVIEVLKEIEEEDEKEVPKVVQGEVLNVTSPSDDADADNKLVSAFLLNCPKNGKLLFNSNGSFTYVPKMGFSGKDNFTYTAYDGIENNIEASVAIKVKDVPGYPKKKEISYKINTQKTKRPYVNPDRYSDKRRASKRTSIPEISNNADGKTGLETVLDVEVHDGEGISEIDEEVSEVPASGMPEKNKDKKVVQNKVIKTPAKEPTDDEANKKNTSNTAFLLKGPKSGKLLFSSDTSFTYVPKTGFSGDDKFTYKINNIEKGIDIVTVAITVDGTGPKPVLNYTLKTEGGGHNE